MDGIQALLLGHLRQLGLAVGGAVLGLYAHLKVLLGAVGDHLAQHLGKLGGVLGLLIGGLLPVEAYLGITLAVGDPGHGQIHTHLCALALEVGAQTLDDLLVNALGHAHHVLGGPGHIAGLGVELLGGGAADRALLGGAVALMDITAYAANKLHGNFPPDFKYIM